MRCKHAAINYLLLMLGLVLLPAPLFANSGTAIDTTAETIVFNNFSKQITLIKQHQQQYQVEGTGQQVALSNRLIVKAQKQLTKVQFYQFHPQITQVTELFKGSKSHYFSLTLKDETLLAEVLKALQKKVGIELVQPDVLQLKSKAETTSLANKINPYLELLDIQSLWQQTKGKGVKIAIIDDGFNMQHPDLQHITPLFSYDAENRALSAAPHSKVDSHGTKVAGVIFAAHNSVGINGIAPEAELITLRQPDSWTSNTLLSFQVANLAGADIINCSWHTAYLLQPIADVVNELSQQGRDGKGIAVIFSSGNQGREITALSSEAAIAGAIVVGATGHDLIKPLAFSNYGQSVDLLAYGLPVKTTLAEGGYGRFSGTSLSAAVVAGLSALIISQQPDIHLEQLLQTLQSITTGNRLG